LRGMEKKLLKKLPPQFGEKLEEIPNVLAVQEKSIKIVMEKINFYLHTCIKKEKIYLLEIG
jgi:hypothetical protein